MYPGAGGKRRRIHVDDEDQAYCKDVLFTSDSTIGRRQLTKNQIYGSTTVTPDSGTIDLGSFDLNLVHVAAGAIDTITSDIPSAYRDGKMITLLFDGASTVTSGTGTDNVNVNGASFAADADDTLTLVYSATKGYWSEVSRAVL